MKIEKKNEKTYTELYTSQAYILHKYYILSIKLKKETKNEKTKIMNIRKKQF